MFRHSEIQALLKEQRLDQQPQAEAGGKDEDNHRDASNETTKEDADTVGQRSHSKKQKKAQKKSEKQDNADWHKTQRRLARELDVISDTPVELDY